MTSPAERRDATRLLVFRLAGLATLAAVVGLGTQHNLRVDLQSVPHGLPIPAPSTPIVDMELCEDMSEEMAGALTRFGRELAAGQADAGQTLVAPDFVGHGLHDLRLAGSEPAPLGATRERHDPASAAPTDRDGWLGGLRAQLGGWRRVDCALWTVLAAEFEPGPTIWSRAELRLFVRGRDGEGRVRAFTAEATGQLHKARGRWQLRALELRSLETTWRESPVFAEVSAAAGMTLDTGPYEREPLWSGASAGDVDGDGRWDLFVPGEQANALYLARPQGGYDERGAAWGLARPAGGSGSLCFDFDDDGDQDLALADIGTAGADGRTDRNPLRLYRNDGGRFSEVGEELGLRRYMASYSLVSFDHDNDGALDLFVCNYGRFSVANNENWTAAANAEPNVLFRNRDGQGFEDVSAAAGVDDRRWTFAAAAADTDRDGHVDLYVANDFGRNALLHNQGDGTFVDVSQGGDASDLGYGMSAAFGDLDNDGLLDLYVSNMGIDVARRILGRLDPTVAGMDDMAKMARGNTILLRRGEGFEAAPASYGGIDGRWAWAALPLDVDLDGRLDVFCTNGYITKRGVGDANSTFWRHVIASSTAADEQPSIRARQQASSDAFHEHLGRTIWYGSRSLSGWERDKLWVNNGPRGFVDASDVSGVDSLADGRGAIAADLDDDGDVDLFVTAMQGQRQRLFRNDLAPAGGGLSIQLRATRGHWQAVGAEVRVQGAAGPCSQVLALGAGFLSASPPELVFGLGDAPEAQVEVLWPGAVRESFGTLSAGSKVLLVEGAGVAQPLPRRPRPLERD